ncbi:MAG: DUF4113 domain-containing protein [Rhodoferax sp.]|nr:DUF4113 domain-containing protein [Rhodoferax sp.]
MIKKDASKFVWIYSLKNQQLKNSPCHAALWPTWRTKLALDNINSRFGKGTLQLASAGLDGTRSQWGMKQERRTPAYTTDWRDIPVASA